MRFLNDTLVANLVRKVTPSCKKRVSLVKRMNLLVGKEVERYRHQYASRRNTHADSRAHRT